MHVWLAFLRNANIRQVYTTRSSTTTPTASQTQNSPRPFTTGRRSQSPLVLT